MRLNILKRKRKGAKTHEGAEAFEPLTDEQRLRRSVLSCMLWEDEFYEDGEAISARIGDVAARVDPEVLAKIAIEARTKMNLRHAPLLLLTVLARTGAKREKLVAKYAKKYAELKAVADDAKHSDEQRYAARLELQKLPRNANPTRLRNRCAITGRPRGTFRMFGLGRNKIRELAFKGEIPGVVKASW